VEERGIGNGKNLPNFFWKPTHQAPPPTHHHHTPPSLGPAAHLGAEREGGQGGLVLGLLSAPGVEELEALIAEGGTTLCAALGGL
jgi:hypothetical protein